MSSTLTASSSHSSLRWTAPSIVPLAPLLQRVYLSHFAYKKFRPYIDNLADIRQTDSESLRIQLCKVRSVHPCLRHFSLMDYHYGKDFWILYLDSATKNLVAIGPVPLYVGRRPVYVAHGEVEHTTDLLDDVLNHEVDPTRIVSDADAHTIQKHFRYSYGVRLHIWGFWDVLFKTSEDLFRQKQIPIPSRIGSLGFAFIVSEHVPTSSPSTSSPTPFICSLISPLSTILPSTQVIRRSEADCSKKALISGSEYLFEADHVKRSLIWRTEVDGHSLQSASGSVVCWGKPADKEDRVVILENFQTPVSKRLLPRRYYDRKGQKYAGLRATVTYKGGFLPTEILDNAVIEVEGQSELINVDVHV